VTVERPFSPETLATRWGCSSEMQRLLSRINCGADDECWLWQGPVHRTGYGNAGSWFYKNMGTPIVHRAVYLAVHGELPPPPLEIRHTCDNRLCCNPRHLIPGTRRDNMADMVVRGRSTKGRAVLGCGENHPRSKLTTSAVASVFAMHRQGFSQRMIAVRVGVSHQQVGRILRGESRAHEAI
jgi:hypothetical protein